MEIGEGGRKGTVGFYHYKSWALIETSEKSHFVVTLIKANESVLQRITPLKLTKLQLNPTTVNTGLPIMWPPVFCSQNVREDDGVI